MQNNSLKEQLHQNKFLLTLEIDPPKGPGVKKMLSQIEPLIEHIDAINIAACPVAKLRMDPLAFAVILKQKFDVEVIIHLTMRDMSLLGIQSYLIGASALGIHNILAMTGDTARHSDVSKTKGVFQANSLTLLKIMEQMNVRLNLDGKKLNKKSKFFAGSTANPSAINLVNEVKKINRKIDAGAQFFQTQPLFLDKNLDVFIKYCNNHVSKPILMGTMLLKSYESSLWLNENVPSLFVPSEVLSSFKKNDTQENGLEIASSFCKNAIDKVDGLHLFPMNNYEALLELVQEVRGYIKN
ncbi:methylenetetrahydrofolate reductase [bacterium]|nr:methylenetetrahydrofolate reductase [bacterium]